MEIALWQRLDTIARRILPLAITIMLALAAAAPSHIPGFAALVPAVALISVYYWTIFRPDLMPALAVFAIGLFQDILSGMPLGMNALILLLVYGIVLGQRRFFLGQSFLVMWWGFLLIVAGAFTLMWLTMSALETTLLDPMPALFQALVTLAVFPIFTRLFIRTQQAMLKGV